MKDDDQPHTDLEQLEHMNRVLRRRAERLARVEADEDVGALHTQVALVQVQESSIGIPVDQLRELVACPDVIPLPGLPGWMQGLCQVRGELMTAVSMRAWLDLPTDESDGFLAVVEGREGKLALMVTGVVGFRDIKTEELSQQFAASSEGGERAIEAVTKDLVSVLDISRLLEDPRMIVQ